MPPLSVLEHLDPLEERAAGVREIGEHRAAHSWGSLQHLFTVLRRDKYYC